MEDGTAAASWVQLRGSISIFVEGVPLIEFPKSPQMVPLLIGFRRFLYLGFPNGFPGFPLRVPVRVCGFTCCFHARLWSLDPVLGGFSGFRALR